MLVLAHVAERHGRDEWMLGFSASGVDSGEHVLIIPGLYKSDQSTNRHCIAVCVSSNASHEIDVYPRFWLHPSVNPIFAADASGFLILRPLLTK